MAHSIKLSVCHLYPDLMDTYGDKGNIIALQNRCEARKIAIEIVHISIKDKLQTKKFDLFFFGGGQDRQQIIVGRDLKSKSDILKEEVENGATLLSICGGYQLLLGNFKTLTGEIIEGINLFKGYTEGSTERMIGNILIELNTQVQKEISSVYQSSSIHCPTSYLVGFENHSGKTFLEKSTNPLGTVVYGHGNNSEDKTEGAVYKNAFGCYLHGSLLPKNPHFADFLIAKALERRYGKIKLKPIDDEIEWQAHKSAIERTRSYT